LHACKILLTLKSHKNNIFTPCVCR
jgi:hypothetical protein